MKKNWLKLFKAIIVICLGLFLAMVVFPVGCAVWEIHESKLKYEKSHPLMSVQQSRTIIQKLADAKSLQKQAGEAILHDYPYVSLTNYPAIAELASVMKGDLVTVGQDNFWNFDVPVPDHVTIRLNGQYLFVFSNDVALPASADIFNLDLITNGIYLVNFRSNPTNQPSHQP